MITNKPVYVLYGFSDIIDFYAYIVESRINGQHKQAKELFFMLSEGMQGERAYFLNEYLKHETFYFEESWPLYLGLKESNES